MDGRLAGFAAGCWGGMRLDTNKKPVLLMVSGGSDSTAMLELMVSYVNGELSQGELASMIASAFPNPQQLQLFVLHVNHMLRGKDSDNDERFVCELCKRLNVPCEVARVDIEALSQTAKGGTEAIAREQRYRLAQEAFDRACAQTQAASGVICTAHTLDDRIETFFMRALVGTGPGGFASIPRVRGNVRRPLLDATREQLRDWLRNAHPGISDGQLWCEDESNYTGDNFRARVRRELMPVLRELRPGFERTLAKTLDLIADEEAVQQQDVDSLVYRTLEWDGIRAILPIEVLQSESLPMARRILRSCLLVVNPDARLESMQLERIICNLDNEPFTTEVSGGLRVNIQNACLTIEKVQQNA